ncbi:calcium-activated chloride channel regulator 4-like [Haemaphysalis longicornis]
MTALLGMAAGLLVLFGTRAAALDVDPSDGGYTGLSVSIHRNVPYNETIVENIKALFQSSSEFLHRATNGRVYFKQVTINLPETWPKRPKARRSRAGSFDKSDVRVDFSTTASSIVNSSSDFDADQPFTKQIMRCGRPGDFIQLTPTFLLELNASTAQKFGNPAYVFVHEWAHFRYGVFDEHGYLNDDTYPITYCHQGKVRLNSCSSKIAFTAKTPSGGKCEIDASCRVLSKDCVFGFYQNAEKSVESSVMFMPYVHNVSQFCNDTEAGSRQHNPRAPNKQNAICNSRPTWEVISSNNDFKNLRKPDLSKPIQVTFKETQEIKDVPKRVVMLLDVSNSMETNNRMKLVKEALLRYVIHAAEGSQQLAVVTFAGVTSVAQPLTLLGNATRAGFLKAIQKLRPLDSTCIGCGLKEALKALGKKVNDREGGIITLVSDGEENARPAVAEVLHDVLRAKVIVNTVALGGEADPKLETLAAVTKGKAYFFQDGQGSMLLDLEDAFREAAARAEDAARLPVTLLDTEASFSGNHKHDFFIDDSVGKNTVVYIHTKQSGETSILYAWLADPTGSRCTTACRTSTTGPDIAIKLTSESAMPGKWSLHLSTKVDNKVDVYIQVKSYVRNETVKPVQVNCRVANLIVNKPEEAIVYAEVTKGKKFILDAAVAAQVIGANNTQSALFALRDDGKDPDNHAGDGTYSGYVTEFTGRGRYAVTALVSSHNATRLADRRLGYGQFFNAASLHSSKPGESKEVPSSEYSLDYFVVANTTREAENSRGEPVVHHFQRVVSGGSFQVNMTKKTTPVQPKAIRRLRVFCERPLWKQISDGRPLLKLSWSWEGPKNDPFERFRAIIRGSLDHNKLKTDFGHQTPINNTDIVDGSTAISPTKAEYTIHASMPDEISAQLQSNPTKTVYFAARVIGPGGLRSDVSNIASVSCRPPVIVATSSDPATTPLDMTEPTPTRKEEIDTTPASSISTSTLTTDGTSSYTESGTDTVTTVALVASTTSDINAGMTAPVTASTAASTKKKTTEKTTTSRTTTHDTLSSTAAISTTTEARSTNSEITIAVGTFATYNETTTAEAFTTAGENTSLSSVDQTTAGVTEVSTGSQAVTSTLITTEGTPFDTLSSTPGISTSTEARSTNTEIMIAVGTFSTYNETTTAEAFTTAGENTSLSSVDQTTAGVTEVSTGSQAVTSTLITTEGTPLDTLSSTAGVSTSTEGRNTNADITIAVGTFATYNETTTSEAFTTAGENTSLSSVDQTTAGVTEVSTGGQAVTYELSTTEGTPPDVVTGGSPVVADVRQQKTTVGGLSIGMYALTGGIAVVVIIAAFVATLIVRRRKEEDYIVMFTKSG